MRLPLAILDQHVAILGKTGGGKTYAAKGMVERLLDDGRRVCVVDPTGAWWGLKSSADGKSPGYPVVIFGGAHADVPINEKSGRALGEFIAETAMPAVIDLSELYTGSSHRFVAHFAETVYAKNREPLHLILDEADEWAPQRPLPDTKVMLNRIDRIVRRGRIKGFRVMMISQRPAVLHKDVLTQANALIAMRLTGPQDRAAVNEWIRGQADPEEGRAVIASLPKLKRGEGWVWAPELGVLEQVEFPTIRTFDSSRAPEAGESRAEPVSLADVDLGAIRERFAAAEGEARQNDPAYLRQRIAELEAEAKKKAPTGPSPEDVRQAYQDGIIEGYRVAVSAITGLAAPVRDAIEMLHGLATHLDQAASHATDKAAGSSNGKTSRFGREDAGSIPAPASRPAPVARTPPAEGLTGPQQRILDAIAWFETIGVREPSRIQVAFVAGTSPKSSGYANNLGALRTAGMIDYPAGGAVCLTDAGRAVTNSPDAPPTSEALHDAVLDRLSGPQARIVRALIAAYPSDMTRDDLARAAGSSPVSSGFANNLGSLRSLGLVDYPRPGHVIAEALLFLEG